MKRISAGLYEDCFNGIQFKVVRIVAGTTIYWYWQIGTKPANDWHSTKRIAKEAAIDYIKSIK